MNQKRQTALAGLGTGLVLGMAYLALSLVILVGDAQSSAFDMHFIRSVLDQPLWRTRLFWNVLLFGVVLLILHLGLGAASWLLARVSQKAYPESTTGPIRWTMLWFSLGALWTLCANAYLYPHSALGSVHSALARTDMWGVTVFHVASAVALSFLTWTVARVILRASRRWKIAVSGIALLIAATGLQLRFPHGSVDSDSGKPNVIFIGIDALRDDLFDANAASRHAPRIATFLAGAVRFENATTPLARTFPSWVTLISGKSPRTTGALVNLLRRDQVREGTTIPRALRAGGYKSVYAIDEVRFSNMDATYGFDRAITPPIGASEFLIAWFADTPLSNIVVNTAPGRWLFPHVHANRAAATLYDPDRFIARLGRGLPKRGPLFLATHLTLAHWPFSWADSPGNHRNLGTETGDYHAAVNRVDRQFGDLMDLLDSRGWLKNSIVVVFSDHGEALGYPQDLQDAGPLASHLVEEHHRWGHGSSVLSPAQYRVVLAIHDNRPGTRNTGDKRVGAPVSLEDLAPTIIELLGATRHDEFDGRSLAGFIRGDTRIEEAFAGRIRFTETEFNPQGVSTRQIARDALEDAGRLYHVNPGTDRVTARDALLAQVEESRQYAAIGPFGKLAALPLLDGSGYRKVYIESEPHGLPARFGAERDADILSLTQALETHYGLRLDTL